MDLRLWALAFTVLDWPERQKAEAWAALQAGAAPTLAPEQARALAALAADLPRRQQEAAERGARLLLPGDDGVDPLLAPLPHAGALKAGPTWGVMGSGLDHLYPPEHRPLMDRMVAGGGGVITPFPPEAPPRKWHFPRRNWLLAAWADGVLVTEARLKSGSLVTARLALDLGKAELANLAFGQAPRLP